jgi:hypothetical protein
MSELGEKVADVLYRNSVFVLACYNTDFSDSYIGIPARFSWATVPVEVAKYLRVCQQISAYPHWVVLSSFPFVTPRVSISEGIWPKQ